MSTCIIYSIASFEIVIRLSRGSLFPLTRLFVCQTSIQVKYHLMLNNLNLANVN